MNIYFIDSYQFSEDVNKLANSTSEMKMELFRASNQLKRIDSTKVHKYLGTINGVLSEYSTKFENLEDAMSDATGQEGVTTVSYDEIKPYLYANFDYASIISYTDGLYKGIADGKFKDGEDIQDFYDHTVSIAFKDIPTSTPAILDDIKSLKWHDASTAEAAKFNAVKLQHIFNSRDRQELYKAIESVLNFLCAEIDTDGKINIATDDITLRISFIVSVLDYALYSITAYMGRVIALYAYAYRFISDGKVIPTHESVEVKEKITDEAYKVIIPADDMACRDPKNFVSLINMMNEFATVIGAQPLSSEELNFLDTISYSYRIRHEEENNDDNIFVNALIGNPLYEFITQRMLHFEWELSWKQRQDFVDELHSYVYNGQQGLSSSLSAKQQMIPIIRDTLSDKNNIEDYRKIVSDLNRFSLEIFSILRRYFMDAIRYRSDESNEPRYTNSMLNSTAELVKCIKELYNDLVEVVLSRLRDIELRINKNKEDELNKIFTNVSIDVPGELKSDVSHTHDMMNASPDTSRLPVDLYSLPTYESLRMYSEYVASLPGMEGNGYYSEAVDFSKIVDTLQALFQGLVKKFIQFLDNPKFKNAVNWVSKNESTLNNLTYNGSMEVLPYIEDIKLVDFDAFVNKLKAFNNTTIESDENLKKYLDSLYDLGDQTLTKIWNSNDKNMNDQMSNYILFGAQPGTVVKSKTLTGDASIKADLKIWIGTVKSSTFLKGTITNIEQAANGTIKGIKSQIVNMKKAPSTQTTTQQSNTQEAPELNNDKATNSNQTQQQVASTNNNDQRIQNALSGIQTAFQKVIAPDYMIMHRAIIDQYNYIKTAYNMANKK